MESVLRARRGSALLHQMSLPDSCRVSITTVSGATYTGILYSFDRTSGKIMLKNVTTDGAKLFGRQNYFISDIADINILSDVQENALKASHSRKKENLNFKKNLPKHLAKLVHLDTDDLTLSNIYTDEMADQGIGSSDDEFEDYYEMENFTLICRVSEKFDEAMAHIMEQSAVGVQVYGQKLGRDGTLSIVQIATESSLIMFDMLRLGVDGMKAGLQALFEDEHIMKVIHDCRWISDLMRFQFNVSLVNIFDTQVANVFVYRSQTAGDWPRYVDSLSNCLISYLQLPFQDVFSPKVTERSAEVGEAVWLQRPLPEKLLKDSAKNTVYLLRLHHVMLREMLMEFRVGVELYLDHVSGTTGDVERCRINSHLLPSSFTSLPEKVKKWPQRSHTCYDLKGFRENDAMWSDKSVIFSHDSMWHKASDHPTNCFGTTYKAEKKSKMAAAPAEFKAQVKKSRSGSDLVAPQEASVDDKSPTVSRTSEPHVSTRSLNEPNFEARVVDKAATETCLDTRVGLSSLTTGSRLNKTDFSNGDNLRKSTFSEDIDNSGDSTKSSPTNQPTSCSKEQVIRRSRLWQLTCKNEQDQLDSATEDVNVKPSSKKEAKNQSATKNSFNTGGEEEVDLSPFMGMGLSTAEMEQVKELKRKIAILDKPHTFVSAKTGEEFQSVSSNSKDYDIGHQSDHSTSMSFGSHKPQTVAMPHSSSCSSDNENESPNFTRLTHSDKSLEGQLSSSAFAPAGMHRNRVSNKTKRRLQGLQHSEFNSQGTSSAGCVQEPSMEKSELGAIPTPHTLTQQKTYALGVSSIGIGDLFSEDEGFSTPTVSKSNLAALLHLQQMQKSGERNIQQDDGTVSEEDVDKVLQSERSQRVLRLAASRANSSVKDRLLPAPLK